MMDLFEYVGKRIRDLRISYGEEGLSQEALAKAIRVTTNTISRWETATYHPGLKDLEGLARFFGVSILTFFPSDQTVTENARIAALLRAAKQLPKEDIEELRRYAEFRRARNLYGNRKAQQRKRKAAS